MRVMLMNFGRGV